MIDQLCRHCGRIALGHPPGVGPGTHDFEPPPDEPQRCPHGYKTLSLCGFCNRPEPEAKPSDDAERLRWLREKVAAGEAAMRELTQWTPGRCGACRDRTIAGICVGCSKTPAQCACPFVQPKTEQATPEPAKEAGQELPAAFLAEHARVVALLKEAEQKRGEAEASRDAAWRARESFRAERDAASQRAEASMQAAERASAREQEYMREKKRYWPVVEAARAMRVQRSVDDMVRLLAAVDALDASPDAFEEGEMATKFWEEECATRGKEIEALREQLRDVQQIDLAARAVAHEYAGHGLKNTRWLRERMDALLTAVRAAMGLDASPDAAPIADGWKEEAHDWRECADRLRAERDDARTKLAEAEKREAELRKRDGEKQDVIYKQANTIGGLRNELANVVERTAMAQRSLIADELEDQFGPTHGAPYYALNTRLVSLEDLPQEKTLDERFPEAMAAADQIVAQITRAAVAKMEAAAPPPSEEPKAEGDGWTDERIGKWSFTGGIELSMGHALRARNARIRELEAKLRVSLEQNDALGNVNVVMVERDRLRAKCSRQRKELRLKERKLLEIRGAEFWWRNVPQAERAEGFVWLRKQYKHFQERCRELERTIEGDCICSRGVNPRFCVLHGPRVDAWECIRELQAELAELRGREEKK